MSRELTDVENEYDRGYRVGYQTGHKQGREDAYKELIDRCKRYAYVCDSNEFAKVLEDWMVKE